ncbi:hypothetical protein A7U60_g8016 [Sanghuangporus baumii]|uniref:Uncharacterized protein n=1 Tax=Sanghuangporus baumii TaxID=108892 RepID=A0A9Q5HS85_SANBA|nr:hypothetical protein A7U60_g8016 [Sanghuangporus baumii]
MSYPQSGWAPPPPAPHAYAGPGGRPWMPYGVPPPHAYPAYPHTARPPEPPKDEYWATELKPNPLGLENMHIRAEELRKENNNNNNSSSSNTARVPSQSSYSCASDYALRNSYPPNASTRASLAPTNSHPNTRVPSPAPRPRQYERERDRDRDRDVIAPSARYATYPETTGINGTTNTAYPPTAYQRSPSRAYGGRTSVPVEAGDRYSSASASAAAAQMAARSQTLPGASGRRHTTAAMAGADVPQAQGMQRSKTMPGEMLGATMARDRASAAIAQVPRRSSDRYQYRQPQDDYEESEEDGNEDEESEEDPVQAGWTHVTAGEGVEENRKERKTTDRVRAWAENVKNMVSSHHGRDGGRERDQEPDRETARMKEKSRSKSYHYAPRADGDFDGYDDEDAYDAQSGSAALYARERERERERGRITRHASAPDATYAPLSKASQSQSTSYAGVGEPRITEEPEDMHNYSQQEPLSRSGSHRSQRSQTQYPSSRQSPYKGRDRDWEYRERYRSESSSGSESDEESEDEYERQQALGRMNNTRGRERKASATPHPVPSRRLTERSDTLRVDGGVDPATVTHGKAHLPSPRSLRQSSRTPSSRPSYEQVQAEREREYERAKTVNGHLAAGTSSASAAAAIRGYVYGTPPVTPTRQDHMHRTDSTRSPYASQPTSAAAMAHATEPASAVQTPARLAYLYRGTSASPSPASHRAASTQPQTQMYPHQHAQSQVYPQAQAAQYGMSSYPAVAEPKPRKRSPHASRSPSPLPSGQGTSSSSAYYAALGRERTPSRAQSHTYSQSHGQSPSHTHRHGHSHSHTHHTHSHGHSSSQVVPTHDGQRRSTSRATALVGSGYSSASGAAAASSAQAVSSGNARHVRSGFWNKRGDHLTDTGYVVYCPPGRCYPRELADYPDNAFRDHLGNVVYKTPDVLPELPESVPKSAGRAPEKGYDTFIRYVLVGGKS